MKKIALTFTMIAVACTALAQQPQIDGAQSAATAMAAESADDQPPGWKLAGVGGVTLSQVSLTDWAAGGEGSLALDAMLNYDAVYTNRRHLWQNRLELAYGTTHTKAQNTRKTNDKIFLTSMYGYRLTRTWYASLLGVFQTQFARGYDYTATPRRYLSRFLAPGYVGIGAGLTWKPNTWLSAYISPATWRATIVSDSKLFLDPAGAATLTPYGVEPGHRIRHEFGANVRVEVNRDLLKNMHLYSRLDLFSNYLHKPQNIDVRWYTQLAYRINEWIGVNLSLDMLYDDDVKFPHSDGTPGSAKLQIKEVLGIGLQAQF